MDDPIRIYVLVGIPEEFINNFDVPCSSLGWFPFFGEARNSVLDNYNNIGKDGYFKWIVIEEIESGFPSNVAYRSWYEWGGDQYYEIDPPNILKMIKSYAMGL